MNATPLDASPRARFRPALSRPQTTLRMLLSALCLAAGGCAATGASYNDHASHLPPLDASVARLSVYRPGTAVQYSGTAARVLLDGKSLGNVAHQGFNVFDVATGPHVLSVDSWGVAGACRLDVDFKPSGEYYFEVEPRTGSGVAVVLGGLVGAAIESAGKDCGGAFRIAASSRSAALPALVSLKASH